ncbi:hypothetical protein EJV47_03835 [Hymenobacter gummosus]|uniref:DUF4221 domain-containing protein n=1 Tax=Hymenobacter gummosus TaxID=1776032 RepID=A0A431U6B7_9BACT|nr:hypothetical protein [Hymenobacter gummosus]RTQ52166.1 hypothetical protein EJV47_03835 [Hymenobacter gummosus]
MLFRRILTATALALLGLSARAQDAAPTAYLLVNTGDCINCYLQVHQLTGGLLRSRPVTLVFPAKDRSYAPRFITDQLDLPASTPFVVSDSLIQVFSQGKPLESSVGVRQGNQTLYFSPLRKADLPTIQRLLPAAPAPSARLGSTKPATATGPSLPSGTPLPAAARPWTGWAPVRLDSLNPRTSNHLDLSVTPEFFALYDYNYGAATTLRRADGQARVYSARVLPTAEAYRLYFGDTADYHARRPLIRLMETKVHKPSIRAEGLATSGDTVNVLYSIAYPEQKGPNIGIGAKFLLVQYLHGQQRAAWPLPDELGRQYYLDQTGPFRLRGRRLLLPVGGEKLGRRNPVYATLLLSPAAPRPRFAGFVPYQMPPFFRQHGLVYEYNLGYLEDELFHFHYANEVYDLGSGRTYRFDYQPTYQQDAQAFTASVYTLSVLRLPGQQFRVLTARPDSFYVATGRADAGSLVRLSAPRPLRTTPAGSFSNLCLGADGYAYYVDSNFRLSRERVE